MRREEGKRSAVLRSARLLNEQCHASNHPGLCVTVLRYRSFFTVSQLSLLPSFLFLPPRPLIFFSFSFVPPSISADSLNYLIARTKETRAWWITQRYTRTNRDLTFDGTIYRESLPFQWEIALLFRHRFVWTANIVARLSLLRTILLQNTS